MTTITTPTGLQAMGLTGSYELGNDIDMSGISFTPIGYDGITEDKSFRGSFNGNGYTISNLSITASGDFSGLFGVVGEGASFQNVKLSNVYSSGYYAGGLIGQVFSANVTIYQCSITGGTINTTFSDAGGIVGQIFEYYLGGKTVTVSECFATSVNVNVGGGLIGGGYSYAGSLTISNCYATGTVGAGGGLVGNSYGIDYINCYSTTVVTSGSGFTDSSTDCTYSSCYWDTQTSGQGSSAGDAVGKTTAQMQTQSTFTGWNFTTIWAMSGYPILRWSGYVVTVAASSVTSSSAILNGTEVGVSYTYFEYGRATTDLTFSTPTRAAAATFAEGISGLSPNVTYYFRAVGYTGATYSNGSVLNFTTYGTPLLPPEVNPATYGYMWTEGEKMHFVSTDGVERAFHGTTV